MISACHDPVAPKTAATPTAVAAQYVTSEDGLLHLTGPAVVVARPWAGFVERKRFAMTGVRAGPGGCHFKYENLRLKRGEHFTDHVAEVDSVGCNFVVARGDLVLQARQRGAEWRALKEAIPATGVMPNVAPSPLRSSLGSGTGCGFPALDGSNGYQKVFWLDPATIEVVSDRIDLQWAFNWECVSDFSAWHTMNWFIGSGWTITGWSSNLWYDFYLTWVNGHGVSQFYNPGLIAFPPGFPLCTSAVTAYVWRNDVYGYVDGTASFNLDVNLSGPACTDLLSVYVTHDNTGGF